MIILHRLPRNNAIEIEKRKSRVSYAIERVWPWIVWGMLFAAMFAANWMTRRILG